ncbi:hypothetical protein BHYA_0094g00170 [Botrytis hyacinthi]|uniref:Uncharacterized protein n=1 Tax=Botrytis hyacinthi TaxID=278943 RepID=A0A4Z1GKT0_9HELO|nr:hypothetical protein BHYA_0094g00170 [Botrytis hyacinthi]
MREMMVRMMDMNGVMNWRNSEAVIWKAKTELEALVMDLHIPSTPEFEMLNAVPAVDSEI